MKILFVSLFLPQEKSYHAGGRYVFELLKNLSKKHEITLFSRLEETELSRLDSLKPYCSRIYPYPYRSATQRGVIENIRLVLNYFGFSRYADRLIREGGYDLVQVEWVEASLLIRKGKTPMILDAHDVITKPAERAMRRSHGMQRLTSFGKYCLVKAIERRCVRKFDVVFTLSEYDENYLLDMEPELKVLTVPIPAGLDITDRTFEQEKNTILFLASYKYRKVNVDAALYFYNEIFTKIRIEVPAARFIIAGYGPPGELTALQEKDSNVTVTGFVEDIDGCYKRAAAFAAPIQIGGGIIMKILDAMAAGTPVVTTSYGNEGIGAVPGRDLIVADDPDTFAASVVRLLHDPSFAGEIGQNGKGFVERHYTLDAVMARIESVYRDINPLA